MTVRVRFEIEMTFYDFLENSCFIMGAPMTGTSITIDPADINKIDMAGIVLLYSGGAEC